MLGNIRILCELKWAHLLPYQRINALPVYTCQWYYIALQLFQIYII